MAVSVPLWLHMSATSCLPTLSQKMRFLSHTDAENEPTWKPVEFPGMTGAIVLQGGGGDEVVLWQGGA